MKKLLSSIIALVFVVAIVLAGTFYWNNLRGIGPALQSPPQDIRTLLPPVAETDLEPGENNTDFPLQLLDGFSISIFADTVPGARVIAQDRRGNFWVSQKSEGSISLLVVEDGLVTSVNPILRNLNNPHGLAFDLSEPDTLYYAEENKISRILTYSEAPPEKIIDLPAGGRHTTRTLLFGPDNRLYVSIGSSCDVCVEEHEWLATIISMERDGSDARVVAKGLRNAVFMDIEPITGVIWATEMGRDRLGDDLPPDELNAIVEGADYGWPVCYGQNIHDTDFDKNTYIRNPCEDKTPARVDIQAHSAPLGIGFVPEEGWPEDMWYDAIVAYHGSWNRTEPTGYKLVRHKFDGQGNYEGVEDFLTGWLTSNGALGRPVDIFIQPGGVMFVSDDKAGVIYKIARTTE